MKIIYFTTAIRKEDYASFSMVWDFSLNTSIQNLHNRFIRALGLTHEVEVISIRPFSRKHCKIKKFDAETKQEGKITWHYLEIKRPKIARVVAMKKQCNKLLAKMNLKDCIVLTDTLNPNILNNATRLANKYDLPIIGVCHNTPSGIHDTGRSYTTFLLSKAIDLSGYISLTPGLNELFNKNNRANMSFEGVLEDKYQKSDASKYGQYLYYDGSLEEKYGIYDLIKAYKTLNDDKINLVISGYHANLTKLFKSIEGNDHIIYLGMIQSDEALSLMDGSLANINPRPYSEDYDRYMIPDNLVNYLAANSLTISVRNRHFKKYFNDDAIWIDSNEVDDLVNGIKKALSINKNEKDNMIKRANATAQKLYSMDMINHRTMLFLKQFVKQKD